MAKEIVQYDNEVIIHQDVARMRGRLTTVQSRSVLAILKRANEQALENPNIKTFSIPTNVFLDDIQNKDNSSKALIIQKVSKHLETLMTKIFEWGTVKKISKAVFMQQISVTEEEVTFKFSDYIREHIKPISNALIIRDFVLLQSFRSEYARQLYKHLMMWEDRQTLYLSIKDLKDFLGVPDKKSYERMDNLKRKVLKVAIDEINEKCPWMQLMYTNRTKRGSRKIEGFTFSWLKKPEKQQCQQKLFKDDPAFTEQVEALKGKKIYIAGKLFFFAGTEKEDGYYTIKALTPDKQKVAKIKTTDDTEEMILGRIKKMTEE